MAAPVPLSGVPVWTGKFNGEKRKAAPPGAGLVPREHGEDTGITTTRQAPCERLETWRQNRSAALACANTHKTWAKRPSGPPTKTRRAS